MADNSFDWLAYFALETLRNVGLEGVSRLLYAKIIWNKLELDGKSDGLQLDGITNSLRNLEDDFGISLSENQKGSSKAQFDDWMEAFKKARPDKYQEAKRQLMFGKSSKERDGD